MKNKLLDVRPNKYDFYKCRKFKVPAPHFEYICLPQKYNLEQSLSNWINENLKGRYYIGKSLEVDTKDASSSIVTQIRVGFEDPKELSYFTLACPLLKYT